MRVSHVILFSFSSARAAHELFVVHIYIHVIREGGFRRSLAPERAGVLRSVGQSSEPLPCSKTSK